MFTGSATIMQGSLEILAAGSELIVELVHASADGVVLVLRGASELARITLHVAGNSVAATVVAAGTVLVVSATAAGHILLAGAQVVAFVPSTVGRSLVHSSYYGAPLHPGYGGNLRHAWVPDSDELNFNEGE